MKTAGKITIKRISILALLAACVGTLGLRAQAQQASYRAQHHIESAFRDMKNPHFLGWSPMFHWTDSKIRVHAFSCVLALTLTSLLQRDLHGHGIDLSLSNLMQQLGAIKEIFLVYPKQPGPNPPKTAACLSSLDEDQTEIYSALNLARYSKIPA